MSPDQVAGSIWYLGALVLVGSGLLARRLPKGKAVAMGASWAGIIMALWALISTVQKVMTG